MLDATPYTIIGVLPEGFEFPFAGVDVWVTRPSEFSELPPRFWRNVSLLTVFARLKPGVSLAQASAQAAVLNRGYIAAHPEITIERDATIRVMQLKDMLVTNVRATLWTLFGAVGFVLLIACANVASLLLARAASRSREFAVRTAVGAGRGRLVRQLLAESLVLAGGGGLFGVLFAKWGVSALTHMSTFDLPRAAEIRVDGVVLGFAVALSIVTGILSGLIPALRISLSDVADLLRESGAAAGRGQRGSARKALGINTRGLLVVGQVALSVVLLIGAALLIKSFARLRGVDPGFQPANVLTMKIALPPVRYDKDQKKVAFFQQLVSRVQTLPGVRDAAMAMSLPTTSRFYTNVLRVERRFSWNENEPPTMWQLLSITPDYFQTLRMLRTENQPRLWSFLRSSKRLLWTNWSRSGSRWKSIS